MSSYDSDNFGGYDLYNDSPPRYNVEYEESDSDDSIDMDIVEQRLRPLE